LHSEQKQCHTLAHTLRFNLNTLISKNTNFKTPGEVFHRTPLQLSMEHLHSVLKFVFLDIHVF